MSKYRSLALAMVFAVILVGLLVIAAMAQAQGGMIIGQVTSPGGYPLPGGTVVKLFEPGEWDTFGQAAAEPVDGSFSLGPVPNGLYVVKAVAPPDSGYTQSEIQMVSILNGSADVGDLALTLPQIVGAVLAPDGITPADAWIKVYAADRSLLQRIQTEAGGFLIGGLTPGGYRLVASPIGPNPYWDSEPMSVSVGATELHVSLTLSRADIYGRVQDELNNPIPHATVFTFVGRPYRWVRTDQSDALGRFSIGDLDQGSYVLGALPPWDQGGLIPPRPLSITVPSLSNPYVLTFGSANKTVSGSVSTNTGEPVKAAHVIAHRVDKSGRLAVESEPDGSYRLDLTPGLWALTIQPISVTQPARWVYNKPPQLVHFEHTVDPEHKAQDFVVITADAHVTGQVALPAGSSPTFTVTVALHNDEGVGLREQVDPGGAFDIALPHGAYKVWVTAHDDGHLGPVIEPIQVPPSSTVDLGTLFLLERNAAITGTVADERGAGIAGIPVSAWRPGAPGGAHARSGPDGVYILATTEGEWHIQPSPGPELPYLFTGTGSRVIIGAAETVTDVNLRLVTADAVISGVLLRENGRPASDAFGWAAAASPVSPTLHSGAPITAGTFSIHVPSNQTYVVAAHLPAGSAYMSAGKKTVSVGSGETVTVALTVKAKDATIDGALWDPRNQAVVDGVDGFVGAWSAGNWAGTHINSGNGTFRFDVASGVWHLGYRIDPGSGYVKLLHHRNVPVPTGQSVHIPLPIVPTDGAIAGTVLNPNGDPLPGATVIVDGVGPDINRVWLSARAGADGRFRLAVPYGEYHLGATVGVTTSVKPAIKSVIVRPESVSAGHVLQFVAADATISGNLEISATPGITETALVWAWSDSDGFVKTRVPINNSSGLYSLDVVSNTTWHLGAIVETPAYYWIGRAESVLGSGNVSQDIMLNGPHPKPGPVAVTFDASQPQRIQLSDGAHIYIPGGALPVAGRVTLHIVPIATLPHQRHANILKYGYAFSAMDSAGQPITERFRQDVVIGFPYDEAELRRCGLVEHFLKPAYFSTTTNRWTFPDSYAVDTENNKVMMQIDHFTDFALTGTPGHEVFLPLTATGK